MAWRFCLTELCGTFLGVEGEQALEQPPASRFLLELDLLELCGPRQRRVGDDFLQALQKIAALDPTLKAGEPGADIEIPVGVCLSPSQNGQLQEIRNVAADEKKIKQQWQEYYRENGKEEVESQTYRCTFVLEPMIARFQYFVITDEMATTVGQLLQDNVWFAQLKLDLRLIHSNAHYEGEAQRILGKLIPKVFDTTRRSLKEGNADYRLPPHLQKPLQ
ncbi:unnamed protein product [Phytophthora lilii]|uniref:Unnamed protein product n=1 Tax=Phytophthora lilii TaxID=2077276 RepID=A0A9W6WRZ9_9STRA|nr:unnamed protein product [Phytophthora lilii]